MTFKIWGLAFSLCFLNTIFATNHEHESEYNCSIDTVDNGVRDKMKLLLEDGKKVTFIHLVFINQTNPFSDAYLGDIYRPMNWVRIAGRHGRSLLFLRPEFEELSLTTLSLETGYIEVSLVQKPNNCLLQFNFTIVEDILRDLLLSDFKQGKDGGSLSEHEYICNMHIRNDNYNAVFFYRCCHKDPNGNIVCENLIYDFWIYVVFICVIIINIVAVMFSPYLIPDSLYRMKYGRIIYEHELLSPLQIKVKKIVEMESVNDHKNVVNMKNLKETSLWQSFDSDTLKLNEATPVNIKKIYIEVQYRKLIPANYVPVGILQTFYTMFVKCHIRKTSTTFEKCCSSNLSGCKVVNNNAETEKRDASTTVKNKKSWYWCLKKFMQIVMLFVISVPWIFRIIFFYWYEKPHTLQRMTAASQRNMTLSFQWNLINTLTPMHILFLACYTVTVVDAVVYGTVSHKIKEKLQFLMRKCLRDMREMPRSNAFQWSALVLVVPFEKFGIFGFLLIGIYFVFILPVIAGVLAFYCFPTVNLVLRLLVHFFAYLMPNAKASITADTSPETIRLHTISDNNNYHTNVDSNSSLALDDVITESTAASNDNITADTHPETFRSHTISDNNNYQTNVNSNSSTALDDVTESTDNSTADTHPETLLLHNTSGKSNGQTKVNSNSPPASDDNSLHKMFHLDMLSKEESIDRPQDITIPNRFLQLFVLIACLTTVISFILLTLEMVLFITEIFIYTIIGIIMNASEMLKYISLIFMLVLYARDCFKGISDKYLEFNKSINGLIVEKMRSKVYPIAKESSTDQKNTAFQVYMDDTENNGPNTETVEIVVKDGTLKWKIPRLILFLDKNDKPYLPKKFFKSVCYMETAGVPGPLINNVVQATWRFLCICVFLTFVVLIVLAFGDEYQISGTNQMLATLAGGFLPWVFRNILFKSKDSLALDTKNLSFESNFANKIEEHDQKWKIAGFIEEKSNEQQKKKN